MDKNFQKKYKREIREIKLQNIETLCSILNYAVSNVLQSSSSYEKNKRVVSEFYAIAREEAILLDFLKKNLDRIEASEFYKILDMLYEVSEKTKIYYYGCLGNKEIDFDFFNEYSKLKKIIDTDEYRKRVFCATLSFDNVKEYLSCLNITDSFWEYITKHMNLTEEDVFYGVRVKWNQNVVQDVILYVPPIKNLETALINIRELTHAYYAYKMIGKEYEDSNYEMKAKNNQIAFKNVYLENKVKQYFRRFDNIQQKK